MSRRAAVIVPALIALALCSPARAATPPPDLVSLEQQMAALKVTSMRFDLQEEFEVPGLSSLIGKHGGGGAPLVFLIAGEGEASTSPEELTATAGLAGAPQERFRVVGGERYSYRREAGLIDGGRPWVRSAAKHGEAAPLGGGGPLAGTAPGAQGTYSGLVEELGGALSITESGPATVDGQRVIEFDVQLDPSQLLQMLPSKSSSAFGGGGGPLEGLGEAVAPSGSHKAEPQPTKLELELFLAPNGLPVRTRVTVQLPKATLGFRVDTLATGIPVHVEAPPPAKVIDEAALVRIERRREARLRARLRSCVKRHRPVGCLRSITGTG